MRFVKEYLCQSESPLIVPDVTQTRTGSDPVHMNMRLIDTLLKQLFIIYLSLI